MENLKSVIKTFQAFLNAANCFNSVILGDISRKREDSLFQTILNNGLLLFECHLEGLKAHKRCNNEKKDQLHCFFELLLVLLELFLNLGVR